MYDTVFSYPNSEMTFSNFILDRQTGLIGVLQEVIENKFAGINKIRIRADEGNGSGHLLHAIANEIDTNDTRIAFLNISEGKSWNELGIRHLNMIRTFKILFVHHLDRLLVDPVFGPEFLKFYDSFECNDTVIIYTSTTTFENLENPDFSGFLKNTEEIYLEPLTLNLKKKWVKSLFGEQIIRDVPEELLLESLSNDAFIKRIDELKINPLRKQRVFSHSDAVLDGIKLKYWSALNAVTKLTQLKHKRSRLIQEQKYEEASDLSPEINRLKINIEEKRHQLENTLQTIDKCSENLEIMIELHSYTNQLKSSYEESVKYWLVYAEEQLKNENIDRPESEKETDWSRILHQLQMKQYGMRK